MGWGGRREKMKEKIFTRIWTVFWEKAEGVWIDILPCRRLSRPEYRLQRPTRHQAVWEVVSIETSLKSLPTQTLVLWSSTRPKSSGIIGVPSLASWSVFFSFFLSLGKWISKWRMKVWDGRFWEARRLEKDITVFVLHEESERDVLYVFEPGDSSNAVLLLLFFFPFKSRKIE